jgi:hypothetical protein
MAYTYTLFIKEVSSDFKVGYLLLTYVFLLISVYKLVNNIGIKREVCADSNMSGKKSKK